MQYLDKLMDTNKIESSDDVIQKALHQREVRLRARYAYEKRRLANDPEYKAKKQAKKQAREAQRYQNDPEHAEKIRQQQRERYARKKSYKESSTENSMQTTLSAFESEG